MRTQTFHRCCDTVKKRVTRRKDDKTSLHAIVLLKHIAKWRNYVNPLIPYGKKGLHYFMVPLPA